MSAVEIIGLAASFSLLAGWRLYACVAIAGLAMRLDLIDAPSNIPSLEALANPWVIGFASVGALAEFFADKVMWLDSIWDGIHTFIRPIGGALLALAIVDASDPAWQIIVLLLGGSAALLSHGAKSGTRAFVNTSPEPFSNIAVSTAEDVVTLGALWLALTHPAIALIAALALLAICAVVVIATWHVVVKLRRWISSS
jgi:Domain of unknown function (DUF4126)